MEESFLNVLQCPITGESVHIAETDLVDRLNDHIKRGSLENRTGDAIGEPIDSALVNETKKWAFPIRNRIPSLLVDDAILIEASE